MSGTAPAGSSETGADGATNAANPALTRETSLRLDEGWAGFDEEALYIERGGERTRVAFEQLSELSYRDTDYFLVVLSVVLVGFGIWFVGRTPASLLFSAVGVASLVRSYRHRGELVVRVSGRAKPLTFHPENAGGFYDALGEAMGGEVVSDRQTLLGS